jgi:ribosome maturation factor RimP
MKKNIKDTVREIIEPTVCALGYRIWDVTYSKIGADYHLEITIDNDEGINIDDCERVHRAIDPLLDEHDPIETFYYLEVSSPGVERELRTDAHVDACVGERVEARFFAPFEGIKQLEGILIGREGEEIVCIEVNGEEKKFPRSAISKLQTLFDF